MNTPAYCQPILALADHISSFAPANLNVMSLPFYHSFEPCLSERVDQYLNEASGYADLLNRSDADTPACVIVIAAARAVEGLLGAFICATGVPSVNRALWLREAGRLVVKNALPRPLCIYAAGSYGDFTTHRLPLAGYQAGLHVASKPIRAQQDLNAALRASRKLRCIEVRKAVQENPNTAIRAPRTGQPLQMWKAEHWLQITWRLGYTTLFDVLANAADAALVDAACPPAPAGLLDAARAVVGCFSTAIRAYCQPAHALAA